jgi:hypothetical protein
MADRARNTAKKKKTYASAVVGIEEKNDFFTLAKCNLKRPLHMPNGRIPNTTEAHSFFVDLKSTDATNAEVLTAINTEGIVGANIRDDLWVIEFVCKNDTSVQTALDTVFAVEGKKSFEAILPRHKANKQFLIKVANVPFGTRQELAEKLSKYWSQYGTVVDAAPYMFPGKPWLTKRWDVLLMLNEGTEKLQAPPVFKIDDCEETLVCSWVGAKKACLRCKSAGHSTSKCPSGRKNQKVGGSANPLQKISNVGQSENSKKKESKILPDPSAPESQPLATDPATGTTSMQIEATVAQPDPTPTSSTSEQTGTKPQPADICFDTPASRQLMVNIANFNAQGLSREDYIRARSIGAHPALLDLYDEIGRRSYASSAESSTVPAFQQQESADPDTPRKGNKRQAKEDNWTPTLRQVMDKLLQLKLCAGCWRRGHVVANCDMGKRGTLNESNLGQVLRHPKFKPILAAWSHQRHQRGQTWVLEEEAEVFIPQFCTKCHKEGHIALECTSIVICTYCKGDHLRIRCPTAPPYAYEQ